MVATGGLLLHWDNVTILRQQRVVVVVVAQQRGEEVEDDICGTRQASSLADALVPVAIISHLEKKGRQKLSYICRKFHFLLHKHALGSVILHLLDVLLSEELINV